MKIRRFFIAAGEVSGDMHAADLMQALSEKDPSIHFTGFGGPAMMKAGLNTIDNDLSTYSTTGFWEWIAYLGPLAGILGRASRHLATENYELAIFVDNQGFNIPLSGAARKAGIPVVYYFPPHVSIWGEAQAAGLARTFNLLIPSLPRDHEVYLKYGANSVYIGHPLLDRIMRFEKNGFDRSRFLSECGLPSDVPVFGLFPGSRRQELKSLLPVMLKSASDLYRQTGGRFIIPIAHEAYKEMISKAVSTAGLEGVVVLTDAPAYCVMSAAAVNIMASGTAVLESVLLRKPVVLCYKISALSFFIGKMLVKGQMVGLPNIILGRKWIPELLQKECGSSRIVQNALDMLNWDREARDRFLECCRETARMLGYSPVITRVADAVLSVTGKGA